MSVPPFHGRPLASTKRGGAMRASANSQADFRRRVFAARKRSSASPAAHVLGERTRNAARGRGFLGSAHLFAAALTATLLIGWRDSEEGHLTPESCVGYWLSTAGASVMLLLYPMRKGEARGVLTTTRSAMGAMRKPIL